MGISAKIGTLFYEITGKNDKFKKNLKESDNAVKKTGKGLSKFGKLAKGIFGVLIVGAIGKTVGALIKAASTAEETRNKFNVVFQDVRKEADLMAETLQKDYGLASEESKALLSATGDLLTGFGVTSEKALDLSFRTQTLAADLASFTNFAGGASGASHALTSALLGETEAAKSLGLALGENQLRDYADQQGKVFKNLTMQEKMFMRLELAVKQSGNAIGDVERSFNSYANVQRRVSNRNKDLAENFGNILLPTMNRLSRAFLSVTKDGNVFIKFLETSIAGLGHFVDLVGAASTRIDTLVRSLDLGVDSSNIEEASDNYERMSNILRVVKTESDGVIKSQGEALKVLREQAAAGDKVAQERLKRHDEFKRQADEQAGIITTQLDAINSNQKIEKEFKVALGWIKDKEADKDKKNAEERKRQVQGEAKVIDDLSRKYIELIANQSGFAKSFGKSSESAFRSFTKISQSMEDLGAVSNLVFGQINGLLQAMNQAQQAAFDNQLARLEKERDMRLEEAGLAEDTAVEKAEKELKAAEESGNQELIQESKQALERAKIEEDYQKQKAELEYKSALAGWEIQKTLARIQLAAAPLNAFVSSLTAPWPLNMILAPINAAIAAATAAFQYKAVVDSKPSKPSFQAGGVVPGSSFTGDQVAANVNSGEMILNREQQANLFDSINNNQSQGQTTMSGQAMPMHISVQIGDDLLYDKITTATFDKQILINKDAVIEN